MRQISVSTDVYAAIWRERQPGEDSEDAILHRVLKVPFVSTKIPNRTLLESKIGFSDPRFGIELPEGFEIFRIYLGTEYRAEATEGKWRLVNTGNLYPSLNQLSRAIGTGVENAWNNWYYIGNDDKRHLVTKLRK